MTYRAWRELRLPEVAVDEVPEVGQVLVRERLVEPVVRAERGDRGGVVGCLLAEVRSRRGRPARAVSGRTRRA